MSPLWLVMLGIGFALAVQSRLIRPEYFSHDFQLFPSWPRFDAALMMDLFWFSMVVLLIPKMLGLIRALLSGAHQTRRRAASSGPRASFLLEAMLSALYAPILMIIQCRHVFEVFMGRDSGLEAAAARLRRHELGRCLALPSAAHAAELRDGRHCVFSFSAAAGLGFARAAWPVSRRAAVAFQRQSRSGGFSVAPGAAANSRGSGNAGFGGAPRGTGTQSDALPERWIALPCAAPRGAASRTSAAICRAPPTRAASPTRTLSPRNRN